MPPVSVRYIVDDVDAALAFYEGLLRLRGRGRAGPSFASVSRGPLRLLLSTPDRTRWWGAGDAQRASA